MNPMQCLKNCIYMIGPAGERDIVKDKDGKIMIFDSPKKAFEYLEKNGEFNNHNWTIDGIIVPGSEGPVSLKHTVEEPPAPKSGVKVKGQNKLF